MCRSCACRRSSPPSSSVPMALAGSSSDERDHLPRNVRVGGLLHGRAQVHHFFGHRGHSVKGWISQPDPSRKSPVTTAGPLPRYGAIDSALARGLAPTHHHQGHDPPLPRYSAIKDRARSWPCFCELHHHQGHNPEHNKAEDFACSW
jgi:hypothetical protein